MEFKDSQISTNLPTGRRREPAKPEPWQVPEQGVMKLNISSSCGQEGNRVGLGVVARDDKGDLVQTWAVSLDYMVHPVMAELEATRVALIVAQQNGWRRVEIQGEIKAIATCLQARQSPILEAAMIADDLFLLALMFETCTFSFVHKSFNRCSTYLARMAQTRKLLFSWKHTFPLWMQVCATEDKRSVDQM